MRTWRNEAIREEVVVRTMTRMVPMRAVILSEFFWDSIWLLCFSSSCFYVREVRMQRFFLNTGMSIGVCVELIYVTGVCILCERVLNVDLRKFLTVDYFSYLSSAFLDGLRNPEDTENTQCGIRNTLLGMKSFGAFVGRVDQTEHTYN